ncbi:uncharacterized protein BKA78DRAFT_32732 [Phyllosticta capitalensis]|uniref:uncharacterized protein n=1 Tax=Phyllosticta capitalensis TaxID=121624 RepID=UPI00312FFC78
MFCLFSLHLLIFTFIIERSTNGHKRLNDDRLAVTKIILVLLCTPTCTLHNPPAAPPSVSASSPYQARLHSPSWSSTIGSRASPLVSLQPLNQPPVDGGSSRDWPPLAP